ncbi:metalloregulator ArsR/SmtB family transcription factor [Micromonospora sp. NPDC049101]|uniref:ArsR/SmtB family transcription factor n=1 Tax=unclassified Micromonospora TaxID=2617518 RepID=UPI0033F86C57
MTKLAGSGSVGPSKPSSPPIPLDDIQAPMIASMFKALGEPVRLRLLTMIAAGGETCVCDLSQAFHLTGPTISYHLKVLRDAGLVGCQRRGTWVYYWVVPTAMHRLAGCLVSAVPDSGK